MAGFIVLLLVLAVALWAIARSRSGGRSAADRSASPTRRTKRRRKRPKRSSSKGGDGVSIPIGLQVRSGDGFTEEDAYKQSQKTWVPPGKSAKVADREIPGGMIYVGTKLRVPQRYRREADPALINPRLKARAKRLDRSGQHLDYWPSYAEIPRSSRAAYLDWLATGRRSPDVATGYVFLFFYGLERRILLDMEQSEQARSDLPAILNEIEVLREVYAEKNNSFNGYSQRLLDFARLRRDGVPGTDASPSTASRGHGLGLADKMSLGTFAREGKPLPPEWALAWLRGSPHHRLNTPGHRCPGAFDQLFKEQYGERFGKGLTVEGDGPALKGTYRPATRAFRTTSIPLEGVVDIDRCSFPEELVRLADDVEAALDSYSRWIGRRDDRSSPAAIGQLPPSLVQDRASEEARGLISEIKDELGKSDYAVVPSEWIVGRWPSKNDGRLTKTEAEGLSGFLGGFGYGIEPDVRYTRNPSRRDHVTLFRLDGEDESPGGEFEAARLLLHLASAVAGADDEITDHEERHIEEHLEDALDLSRAERRRLRAHLERRLAHPPTLRGVRRRAEDLSEKERRQLATYLLTVAGADGQLRGEELNVLEKIYDTLGFDADQVHQDLHRMSSRSPGSEPDQGPVTVIEASADSDEYAIAEEEPPEKEASDGLTLDLDRVKDVQNETRDVAKVLGDVFEEDEEEEEAFSIEGLSAEREALIADLRARPSWPREEFDRAAEEHGLMPGFAIEGINDAAFEFAGEPLLEGEDPIEVNPHALEALQS